MMAAHWLKNGVITYLSHGQGKQGAYNSLNVYFKLAPVYIS